ncbi:hypothetical protein ACQP0C_13330 [Nocardia sp. CA-129566]|uniref:hypothetical protein n=1 Tax=Nocardia sp. CA-129566 TaxID=3239976 RepID=UPI003D987DBC
MPKRRDTVANGSALASARPRFVNIPSKIGQVVAVPALAANGARSARSPGCPDDPYARTRHRGTGFGTTDFADTVAELAARTRITRATFHNRVGSPVELLIGVLCAVTKQDLVDAAVACAPVWWS